MAGLAQLARRWAGPARQRGVKRNRDTAQVADFGHPDAIERIAASRSRSQPPWCQQLATQPQSSNKARPAWSSLAFVEQQQCNERYSRSLQGPGSRYQQGQHMPPAAAGGCCPAAPEALQHRRLLPEGGCAAAGQAARRGAGGAGRRQHRRRWRRVQGALCGGWPLRRQAQQLRLARKSVMLAIRMSSCSVSSVPRCPTWCLPALRRPLPSCNHHTFPCRSVASCPVPPQKNTQFGYSRKDVIIIGVGLIGGGYVLYYGLQATGMEPGIAGNWVQVRCC